MLWRQLHHHGPVDIPLAALQHCLDVPHYRFEILAFVNEHSVPYCHLLLPVLLPFAQGEFLEELVRRYYQHCRRSLESHASLDSDDGVSHVHVTADSVRGCDFLHCLDGLHAVGVFPSVHPYQRALGELQCDFLAAGLLNLLQIGLFRKSLPAVEYLAAADRCSPQPDVVGIFQLCKVGREAVCIEIVHLELAAEGHIPGERDDFHLRGHDHECHIEAHLVVSRSGGAVGDGVSPYFLGILGDCHGLENALR